MAFVGFFSSVLRPHTPQGKLCWRGEGKAWRGIRFSPGRVHRLSDAGRGPFECHREASTYMIGDMHLVDRNSIADLLHF